MFKTILIKIIMVVFSLVACGCKYTNSEKEDGYISATSYSKQQAEEIIKCVENRDKEGLKLVFSKQVSKTHDLDKEIDEFFQFIDGEIVSCDEPEGSMGVDAKKMVNM